MNGFIDPRYPHGKIANDDEGQLQMAITHDGGRVVLRFATPVAWIGFTPQGAADLAQLLIQHARQADPAATFTLTIGAKPS